MNGMKSALLRTTALDQHQRFVPVHSISLTPDELAGTIVNGESDWSLLRALLIEKGASPEKLDSGEFDAQPGETGLVVEFK